MTTKTNLGMSGLALFAVAGLVSVSACGDRFSSCRELHKCVGSQPSAGGAGGDAAVLESGAGMPTDNVDDNSHGGAPSQDGDKATSSAGAPAVTGDAGAPPVVVDTPDEPDSGLGAPCSDNGALSCKGIAQKLSLLCKDGHWTESTVCKADENCDQTSGVCAPILAECKDKTGGQRYCASSGDKILECGADLVSTKEVETCTGKCVPAATSASCAPDTCGDGKTQSPEECDDGNQDQTDGCTNACKKATCGDGSVWKGHEACDDGNTKNDDACTATCVAATCGDGFVWTGKETCDDKNKVNTDACSNTCQKAACGDGILQSGEECDDKNAVSGDGCSKTCTVEPVQLTSYGNATCALGSNGKIRCFGQGSDDWDVLEMALGVGEKATSIAGSYFNLCATLASGAVRCWGDNSAGQLGRGDNAISPATSLVDLGVGAVATSVATGYRFACARLNDGNIKCWGDNQFNQLGIGKNATNTAIGDDPGEMGDSLVAVPQVSSHPDELVVAGYYNACALREDKTVHCWGDYARGSGSPLATVNLGSLSTASQLTVGTSHACAILTNNTLKCWGINSSGELGLDDTVDRQTAAKLGDALPTVNVGAAKTPKFVAATNAATCAVLNDGSTKCWGANSQGRLGTGDEVDVGGSPGDMATLKPLALRSGRKAKQLAINSTTPCALLDDGSLVCWGYVNLPKADHLGDEPNEMGDKLPIVKLKF